MDCCNYGEFRGQALAQYGASAGWEGYGYAPLPYAPYGHAYYSPHAHDPYTRYYRYDYPAHHHHHPDHAMPMDYGAYALKETRTRRVLARREQRALPPTQPLSHPHTPPLECGANGRSPGFCEPQMWPHFQMAMPGGGGWNTSNALVGSWTSRGLCNREQLRYASDCRLTKSSNPHPQNLTCGPDRGSTPYAMYEDSSYNGNNKVKCSNHVQEPTVREMAPTDASRRGQEHFFSEQSSLPCEPKPPPVVPLPAFQQAFGSTEIGKFAEAFSRAEVVHDNEDSSDNFVFEPFNDWDGPPELQWPLQPTAKEIKCEENF